MDGRWLRSSPQRGRAYEKFGISAFESAEDLYLRRYRARPLQIQGSDRRSSFLGSFLSWKEFARGNILGEFFHAREEKLCQISELARHGRADYRRRIRHRR